MSDFDVTSFLTPLSDTAPCGPDLDEDYTFLALETAAQGKPEQQFGDTVIAAQEPDWPKMRALAYELWTRTRDLRIAVWLTRAASRLDGFEGYANGVHLIRRLLESQWEHVHPLLDATANNDPQMRLTALSPLADPATLLADLRQTWIGGERGGISVRQVELGLGKARPGKDEHVPTADGVASAMREIMKRTPSDLRAAVALAVDVVAIEAGLDAKLKAANSLDLAPLRLVARTLEQAAQAALGEAGADPGPLPAGDPPVGPGAGSGRRPMAPHAASNSLAVAMAGAGPTGRDQVIAALDGVCDWIALNEPANPAPLLIRRAQRLMGKSFLDIVRDIAPGGLKEIESLAGVSADSETAS